MTPALSVTPSPYWFLNNLHKVTFIQFYNDGSTQFQLYYDRPCHHVLRNRLDMSMNKPLSCYNSFLNKQSLSMPCDVYDETPHNTNIPEI